MTNADNFSVFGSKEFQNRVLQGTITDKIFFEKIFEILKEDYFVSDAHKVLWIEIRKLFNKYDSPPTYEMLRLEISHYPESDQKDATIEVLKDIEKKVNRTEIEHAKETAFEFCKNQSMKNAILKSVELLKDGKFEEIQKTIEDSLKITTEQDIGHKYFESLKSRSTANHRPNACPTGFDALDHLDVLDGGLAGGELGVVMAPTGVGKSFLLVNFGYGALAAGKNVIHYTFELSENNIGTRYDSRITKVPIKQVVSRLGEVEKKLASFSGGKLIIKEYPTKIATVNTIKFHMGRLISSGFEPDLIIIDYGDLMRSRKGYEQKRYELESIYEDLRGFAMETRLPIWTATQSNREGFNDDIITIDKVGEAISKVHVSDFFATFSQRKFHIGKNRAGKAGVNFDIDIDYARSMITLEQGNATHGGISVGSRVDQILNAPDKLRNVYDEYRDKKDYVT
jgi:replicative DNA helicase